MSTKNTTERAYELRHRDGYLEPCVIVYALTARAAKAQYRVLDDAEFVRVEVTRKPELDAYAAKGGPTTTDLFTRHGWWFGCVDCGEEMVRHERDTGAVVVNDDRHEGSVRCGACVAKGAAA